MDVNDLFSSGLSKKRAAALEDAATRLFADPSFTTAILATR